MLKQSIVAGVLMCLLRGQQAGLVAQSATQTGSEAASQSAIPAQQNQSIPDAPRPQQLPSVDRITPGQGTTPDSIGTTAPPTSDAADGQSAPGTSLPSAPTVSQPNRPEDGPAPEIPAAGQGAKAFTFRVQTNFVEVPFTVKDSKGRLVPGITWRDVRVYENNLRQQMRLFTVDPFPLSVALVVDQSMPFETMTKVNNALSAMQGAFTSYDEVAVFTYNNGPRLQTNFTAAQSARLGAVLEQSKAPGREAAMNYTSGPLSQNININDGAQSHVTPLTNANHGTSQSTMQNVPREVHTLNDAILAAAVATSKAGSGRRRIVYVISDGKEYGSTAKEKDVIHYLQANKIAVFATLVGDSSVPGLGFLDRIHLPLTMRNDVLPRYAAATGGQIDPEFRQKGIESSFARITEEVRTQYTVGYYTHEPFIDGKYRKVEVRVLRPNLTVIAKEGYYPAATDIKPSTQRVGQAPAGVPSSTP